MPTTACLPRLSSRRRDRRRAETGDRISSALPGIRLVGSGEFMGGVLMATARVGMSMTRFSLRRLEVNKLERCGDGVLPRQGDEVGADDGGATERAGVVADREEETAARWRREAGERWRGEISVKKKEMERGVASGASSKRPTNGSE